MDFLQELHPAIGMILLSMLPLFEARYAIPFGMLYYDLPPIHALAYGAVISVFTIMLILVVLHNILPLIKWQWLNNLLEKIFSYTRKKHSKVFETAANITLITFVAIPLPGTGIYSGTIICYLLGFSKKRTLILATIGAIISSLITVSIALGFEATFQSLF